MYIRSQNKETLVPMNGMVIELQFTTPRSIIAKSITGGGSYFLGSYKNQERCIEVLDYIVSEYMYSNHYSGSGANSSDCQSSMYGVYDMPKE